MKRFIIPIVCWLVIVGGIVVVESGPQDYGVELLVYDKDHWMDSLTKQERKAKNISDEEFESRDQRGDIIEIHEYPYYSNIDPKHWGGHAFRVVVVKGITVKQAEALQLGKRLSTTGKRARRINNAKLAEVQTVDSITDITIGVKQ